MKKKLSTFDQFLKDEKIKLTTWQSKVAKGLIRNMKLHGTGRRIGKTFLLNTLTKFINTHGNEL